MLHRLRRSRVDEGFTLVELLMAVIIIGLLAAIAVPALVRYRNRAHDAAAKSPVRDAATGMETYFSGVNTYAGATAARPGAIEPNTAWRTTTAGAPANQVNFGVPAAKTYLPSSVRKSGVTYRWARNLGAAAGVSTTTRSCSPTAACKFKGVAGRW